MRLLARVHVALDDLGVPHALIGAAAMAVRGVGRSTLDVDLLATDARVLDPSRWQPVETDGATVDVRRGDADDPLAGVVRLERVADRPVDVVVGRAPWQVHILARAERMPIGGVELAVATTADLVLLKLYAGGAQDRWDVVQLLAGDDRDAIVAAVDASIAMLPARCRPLWRDVRL